MDKKKTFITAILIFIIFFSLFFFIHSRIKGLYTIDDPYYHVKHAYLMADSGNYVLVKPWLEFHFFKYAPVDAYWGYHIILAVLINFFGILTGAKILASLLSALAFPVFYLILKDYKIKFALLFTFLYFASSYFFQFRLLSERPYIAAFTVLPLGFWLLSRKKYVWLFALSFIYTIFYELSPLIIILAGFYCLAEYYFNKNINLKPIISTAGGVLTGILLHPNFLNYFYLIFISLFQILFLKFSGVNLNVGAELHTGKFFDYVNQNSIGLAFYLLVLAVFFALPKIKNEAKNSITYFLFIYSGSWFVFSLIVPRGIDYWYPFAWLFIVFVFNNLLNSPEWRMIKKFIISRVNAKILIFFMVSVIFSLVLYNFIYIYGQVMSRSQDTIDNDFQEANEWLIKNTPKNSIIFYANWSIWPLMFFYNDHNHYVAGMDPTFLYEYDRNTYWVWKNIGSYGQYCADEFCSDFIPARNIFQVKHAFREVFGSDFIIMNNDDKWPLNNMLKADHNNYRQTFANKELVIYRVLW